MRVVGVDGCNGKWIAVVLDDGRFGSALVAREFQELRVSLGDAAAVAVDIPIGVPERGKRRADLAARSHLGRRASCVFPAPPRAVLEEPDYRRALDMCRSLGGGGLSKQAFALRKKILEVEKVARADDQIWEVHPEVSFQAMAGGHQPLPRKRSWNGIAQRRRLLEKSGIQIPDDLGPAGEVAPHDVLDAAAAAWSALRIVRGEAGRLPEDPDLDVAGRPIAIWY